MAHVLLGNGDPELCIAAGLSPLSTWTITEADSVDIFNYIKKLLLLCVDVTEACEISAII